MAEGKSDELEVKLHVTTMVCGTCKKWVSEALGNVEGVESSMVNLMEASATVKVNQDFVRSDNELNDSRATKLDELIENMVKALTKSGFTAQPWSEYLEKLRASEANESDPLMLPPASRDGPIRASHAPSPTHSLKSKEGSGDEMEMGEQHGVQPDSKQAVSISLVVGGMTCAMCQGRVERAIGKVQGVEGVVVNFLTGRTVVSCMPSGPSTSTTSELSQEHSTADGAGEVDVQALVQSVQAIGYTAIVVGVTGKALAGQDNEGSVLPQRVAVFVRGMVCDGCPTRIEKALNIIEGVLAADAKRITRRGRGGAAHPSGRCVTEWCTSQPRGRSV